ncbi:hypothetical protein [Mesobacillus zeae]|uniref:hypothetical protein n=1 Tax=Mesobacillus zeae TaxID=1917180 RepID=UPI003009FF10
MNEKILKLFESLFDKMLDWFIGPFRGDLDTLHKLIYGGNEKYYGIFDEKQFGVVAQGMAVMQSITVAIILISIILAGMRIASSGINPSNRTYALEYFKDFIICALLFFNLSTIFELMFTVNSWFVTSFDSAKAVMDGDMFDKLEKFSDKGVLGTLVIGLVMLGLWIWANFYYMMRTLTLMILTIMSPLAVGLYLIPQTKGITWGVLKEYAGTVFVQSVHAALYWVVSSLAGQDFGLGSVLLYIIFIPVAESVRALLGLGGQMNDRMSKAAAMFGGAALMGVAGSVKGALNGQTVAQALKGATGQIADRARDKKGSGEDEAKSLLGAAGTDIGSTLRAERMLKAGEILSKGGKAVFGAAGAVAGSPMGPMGSVTGSSIGFTAGGTIGGIAGRAGMAGSEFLGNRAKTGIVAGWRKGRGIAKGEANADEKLANTLADEETTQWALQNKDSFMKDLKERFPDAPDTALNQIWDKEVASKKGSYLEQARKNVGEMKATSGKHARASELVAATVSNLSQDWAKKNKETFMKDYDANNPLPANPTEGDILKHNQNKEAAWQQAITGKKNSINQIATKAASKLGFRSPSDGSFINKDDFSKEVGSQLGSVIGSGTRESLLAVKGATSDVKASSLYNTKSVNTPFLKHQLASIKTKQAKNAFINEKTESGISEEKAKQQWNNSEAPKVFSDNLRAMQQPQAEGGLPKYMPLDHAIIKNPAARVAGAISGGVASGIVATSGFKEIKKFMGDTKLGHGFKVGLIGTKMTWKDRDLTRNVITAGVSSIGAGTKQGLSAGKSYVSENVVGKQAGFRNSIAFATGIVGGVKGYKAGAKYAAGGPQNTKAYGLKGFNPYNRAVNNQVSEISEIQQMVQTISGPNGQQIPAPGSIRMVTTASETVLQVRDKTGQIQTVSRKGSGDSTLKKGEKIFQDLSIQDGQFASTSNVYSEDSGGGQITSNKSINVNPNKLVADRNSRKTPRVIQEVQSYNQLVDSGQYYLKDAMNDMQDIKMVVDRNRSYLVGTKDQHQYRISPYGLGDARLQESEEIVRPCEVQRRQLVVKQSEDYTSSLQPKDLVPFSLPNKRNLMRQQNERFRNKAFSESLR